MMLFFFKMAARHFLKVTGEKNIYIVSKMHICAQYIGFTTL